MNIKAIKKELGLKPKDYYNSSARKRYEESFIRIYSFLKGWERVNI